MTRRRRKQISSKIKNKRVITGFAVAETANTLERTQISKYHTKGGHGFTAEDVHILSDRRRGKKVSVTGPGNSVNGPDRIVDGVPIQTKYFQTSRATIEAAFDSTTGQYRYTDQLLEIPKDQYNDALQMFREKIRQGKVPGITDPEQATQIIKRGEITYKQARNIARAGNIDSLVFDVKTQAVTSTYIFSISFAIDFARYKWNGDSTPAATRGAIFNGVAAGSTALITGVLTAQVLRTEVAAMGAITMQHGIKGVASTSVGRTIIHNIAAASLRKGVYGAAAVNHVAKLLRSNLITATIAFSVTTTPDIYHAAVARSVSWKQFTKNAAVNASGVAGGVGGWVAGAAAGGAIGSAVPVIGTVIGGVAGGIIGALAGSTVSSLGTKAIADRIVSDDVVYLGGLLEKAIGDLSYDFLFSEAEIEKLAPIVKKKVSARWFRQMYKAGPTDLDRQNFAYRQFESDCQKLAAQREKVYLPAPEEVVVQMKRLTNEATGPEILRRPSKFGVNRKATPDGHCTVKSIKTSNSRGHASRSYFTKRRLRLRKLAVMPLKGLESQTVTI
ncbi:MAG: hypothetical protein FOGNACKC_06220 [Anaerolineae bacterium]|nr:hypothetical protein [Anaerolineae bacterium]